MAASIRATPENPVPVTTPSVGLTATTQIVWDTDLSTILARLFVSANGGAFTRFDAVDPAPPVRRGSKPFTVRLGEQYVFELRRQTTEQVLARYIVITRERNALHEQIVGWLRPNIVRLQGIYGLRIDPGVESVRVRLRTRQPTGPVVAVRDAEDNQLAGVASGPTGTSHDITVPIGRDPTPQDHTYRIDVSALSTIGVDTIAEASALFRTGRRRAALFFDRLRINSDGDPGFFLADGDFVWDFGAGEIGSATPFEGTTQLIDEIGSGETRALDRVILIDPAPAGIWVQARGEEDDSLFGTFYAPPTVTFLPDGVTQTRFDGTHGEGEQIAVTRWFDLAALAGPVDDVAFSLETGPRVFDAGVDCRLQVTTEPGAVIEPSVARGRGSSFVPGPVLRLEPGGRAQATRDRLLQRSARGEVYLAERREDGRDTRWSQIAPATAGAITLASTSDRPHLFSLADDGQAQVLVDGAWRAIGGRFVGELLAVVRNGEPELFGLDCDGGVHQRGGDDDWRRIADGVASDLTAFVRGDSVCLIARGAAGEILYRDVTQSDDWTRLGDAPPGRLFAAPTDEGVALAVIGEDETLVVATTDDPPCRLDWSDAGDVTALLDRRLSLAEWSRSAA